MRFLIKTFSFVILMQILISSVVFADSKSVLINGETPEVYYKKFYYHTTGSCYAEGGIWFHFVETFDDVFILPYSSDGRKRRASLALYLSENGKYAADLTDEIFHEKRGDIETFRIVSKERITGDWKISEDGKLEIIGIGEASALIYNGKPALNLKINHDFKESELQNQLAILVNVIGTSGRDPYEQVCGTWK